MNFVNKFGIWETLNKCNYLHLLVYLEYVGDNCEVMFILLLVELLQVGGVIALTVSSHLVPHLSLLSCLREEKKSTTQTRTSETCSPH